MKIVLASASTRRAEILRDAGIPFSVLSSAVDETHYPGESAQDLVQRLATAKAELVDARRMLEKLSGRTHAVVTGVTLIRLPDAERITFAECTLVQFSVLSPEEISRYLASGEQHDKAGAYGIQGRAGRFISRIEGCYFNVVGLPLARLQQALNELGWSED